MNLLHKPVSIASGLVAGKIATRIFALIWGLIEDQEPPSAEHRDVPIWKLAIALLVEGALFAVIRGLIDHGSRHAIQHFSGEWPGQETPERSA